MSRASLELRCQSRTRSLPGEYAVGRASEELRPFGIANFRARCVALSTSHESVRPSSLIEYLKVLPSGRAPPATASHSGSVTQEIFFEGTSGRPTCRDP